MLQEIREIMGLTVSQVADELSQSQEWVRYSEAHDSLRYARMFFDAFPVNPNILKNPDDDPFIPQYEQSSIGERLESWMLDNDMSVEELAGLLSSKPEHISSLLRNPKARVNRRRGEEIEKACGINRKWLMYGDGRNKGKPIRAKNSESGTEKNAAETLEKDGKQVTNQPGNIGAAPRMSGASAARRNASGGAAGTVKPEAGAQKNAAGNAQPAGQENASGAQQSAAPEKPAGTALTPRQAAAAKAREIGKEIRAIRKSLGLTINEAADLLHIRRSVFSSIESGATSLSRTEDTLRAIRELKAETEKRNEKEEARRNQRRRAGSGNGGEAAKSPAEDDMTEKKKAGRGKKSPEAGETGRGNTGRKRTGTSSGKAVEAENTDVSALSGLSKKELGQRIRRARKNRGLSLKQAGDLCGITAPTLSQVECGRVSEKRAAMILKMLAGDPDHVQLNWLDGEAWTEESKSGAASGETEEKAIPADGLKENTEPASGTEEKAESADSTEEKAESAGASEEKVENAEGGSGEKKAKTTRKNRNAPEDAGLGEKLAMARKQAGLSQRDMAALVGMNQSAVSRMESGNPKPELAEKILRLIEEHAKK